MPKINPNTDPKVKPILPKDRPKEQRVSHGGYDDNYIKAFTEHPELGKKQALIAAGYVGDYAKQEAYRIHNRLREKIEAVLDEKILDGAHLGHQTLVKLCKESDSEAVKAKVAKDLIDYAGRKAGDKLIVEDHRSNDELDQEIAAAQQRIAEKEGRHLDS
jgi:hypothetical protein